MSGQMVDELARCLGSSCNRRSALKIVAAAVLGAGTSPARGAVGAASLVTICHRTGSDSHPWEQLRVKQSAVSVHLKHGDVIPDFSRDLLHCGGCGITCDDGDLCTTDACVNGACVHTSLVCEAAPVCAADGICDPATGQCTYAPLDDDTPCADGVCCAGICIDVSADPSNCGGCGATCGAETPNCIEGACYPCDHVDGMLCDGVCTYPYYDPQNCGDCGVVCAEVCDGGNCKSCGEVYEGTTSCPPSGCYNLQNDPQHCGACDHPCIQGETCCAGACVDLFSDILNCGACGNACAPGSLCLAEQCRACPTDWLLCDGVCTSPYDPMNCGVCGHVCSGETPYCIQQYEPGLPDTICYPCQVIYQIVCDGQCVSKYDPDSCGGCGIVCPPDRRYCSTAAVIECLPCSQIGQTDCDGTCRDLSADEENCGACGHVCADGLTCCGGVCVDLRYDLNNCGACGRVCDACYWDIRDGIVCVNCWGSDETLCPDGCKTLATDSRNCGACGNVCPATAPTCVGGVCVA